MDKKFSEMSGLCGFLINPFPDCYCMNMTGSKIMKVTAYCAGDYRACPIYVRESGSGCKKAVATGETGAAPSAEVATAEAAAAGPAPAPGAAEKI